MEKLNKYFDNPKAENYQNKKRILKLTEMMRDKTAEYGNQPDHIVCAARFNEVLSLLSRLWSEYNVEDIRSKTKPPIPANNYHDEHTQRLAVSIAMEMAAYKSGIYKLSDIINFRYLNEKRLYKLLHPEETELPEESPKNRQLQWYMTIKGYNLPRKGTFPLACGTELNYMSLELVQIKSVYPEYYFASTFNVPVARVPIDYTGSKYKLLDTRFKPYFLSTSAASQCFIIP